MDKQSYQRDRDSQNHSHPQQFHFQPFFAREPLEEEKTYESHAQKRTMPKRRKVTHACVYCRRSHMTCDEGRPCQRCIKRSIGHLCHDEHKSSIPSVTDTTMTSTCGSVDPTKPASLLVDPCVNGSVSEVFQVPAGTRRSTDNRGMSNSYVNQMTTLPATPLTFASEYMGSEFTVLNDFLEHFDSMPSYDASTNPAIPSLLIDEETKQCLSEPVTTTEKFFLTAADPSDGTLEDRLKEVINAKYEAGFLKPYTYGNGYARLQKWADTSMSPACRLRILSVMGTIRPSFRMMAQSLTDIDLLLVEEAFERLLLSYDRVFSSMGIPSCLWRRTGEIYKGNKEFAELVGVDVEMLREGRLCIHELMAEESAVNYWEKYSSVAFDAGQKAVLTSCYLKVQDPCLISPHIMINHSSSHADGSAAEESTNGSLKSPTIGSVSEGMRTGESSRLISCCFSFTIRRDKYTIPSAIVGNFLPINCHT